MSTTENIKKAGVWLKDHPSEMIIGTIVIVALMIAILWIVIIHTAFKLHEAKTVGKAKESTCGEFYLEGESARESIYEAYTSQNGGVESTLKTILELMVISLGVLMILVFMYGMVILKESNETFTDSFKNWKQWLIFRLPFITTIFLWFYYYYKSPQDATINPFSDALFRGGQTFSEEEKGKLVGRQVGFLLGFGIILGIFVFLLYKYNLWEQQSDTFKVFLMLFIILSIFIPFLSSEVYTLNSKVRQYYSTKVAGSDDPTNAETASINANIRFHLSDTLFNNNLRNNIRSLHGLSEIPGTLNEQNPYRDKLYRYVLNGVNLAEIRNIVIPEELTEYLDPMYLRGENILVLKYDFLRFYNSTNIGTDFNTYVKKYLKKEYQEAVGIDIGSITTLTCQIPSGCDPTSSSCKYNVDTCNRVIGAVTKHILQNDSYKLNNIVPVMIRSKLQNLRTNTQMEDTVQSYFTTINSLSITLFVVVSYLLFHNFYLQNSETMLTRTSLVMLVLMIVIGLIGWLFKDLWL